MYSKVVFVLVMMLAADTMTSPAYSRLNKSKPKSAKSSAVTPTTLKPSSVAASQQKQVAPVTNGTTVTVNNSTETVSNKTLTNSTSTNNSTGIHENGTYSNATSTLTNSTGPATNVSTSLGSGATNMTSGTEVKNVYVINTDESKIKAVPAPAPPPALLNY